MQKKQQRRPPAMRLSKRQAYPIIEKYFKSGLLPYEFYKQEGWSDNQFFSWRRRYMEEYNMLEGEAENGSVPTSFHPIEISPTEDKESIKSEEKPEQEFTIEIVYPNGVTLRVYSKSTAQLIDLIKFY